jgi:hypothetical protein
VLDEDVEVLANGVRVLAALLGQRSGSHWPALLGQQVKDACRGAARQPGDRRRGPAWRRAEAGTHALGKADWNIHGSKCIK